MRSRAIEFIKRPEGGVLTIVGGVIWQAVGIAHHWAYICHAIAELRFPTHVTEPSAIGLIVAGAVWVLVVRKLSPGAPARPRRDVVDTIEAVLTSSDDVVLRYRRDGEREDVTIVKRANSNGGGTPPTR